jgi:HrpA-like RNA helicase
MTDGLLVAQAFNNESFEGYHTMIIDEAHESNANIALLLVLAKQVIVLRKGMLKIVVMSAAIAVVRFVKFFDDSCRVAKIDVLGDFYQKDIFYIGGNPHNLPSASTADKVE